MKVFLTGGTGFVGSCLFRRLLQDGHQVRALVRRRESLKPLHSELVEEVSGDLSSTDFAQKMEGCDAVINLVGIIYERGKSTFEAVHHIGTRNLVEAARKNGVRRFVQMSALGARASNASAYHTTKFAAEEEVRNSAIPYVILRPSLIFGPGSEFIQQMIRLMRAAPFLRPVPGTGEYRFRPIHVSDVVECFAQALTKVKADGKTIDLVGGEALTLSEIGDTIAHCLNVRKTAVRIPMPLMRLVAAMFATLPVEPPVTLDQLRMLEEGSTADPAMMQQVFGITSLGFREAIRRDLAC